MLIQPINFAKWVAENEDKLKPPVNNYLVQRGDFIIMAVGGPNARTDYHINETEEWFYQYKGDMLLKVVDDGVFKDIPIREGEMFLLPGGVPHNPCRFENTVGIVVERNRPEGVLDRMRWYCERCKCLLFEEAFYCVDLGIQLKPVIEKYYAHRELRTCKACGNINGVPTLVDGRTIRPLLQGEHCARLKDKIIAYSDQVISLGDKQYTLDGILPPSTSQSDIYNDHIKSLLTYSLELGYNMTVFAYGQTGSGKTFTMFGQESGPELGIIPRVLEQVFAYERFDRLKLSFLEIYLEEIYDLIDTQQKRIQIRENASGEIIVPNLTEYTVETLSEATDMILSALSNRATTATSAQLHSSRSHAIIQLIVNTSDNKVIKISLVDLAGSERLKKTKLEVGGSGFQEAIKINSGLLALANVIRSLSNINTDLNSPHVPYRQSKLTRFLKDGLGGDSVTAMIACISPNVLDYAESVNTVSYAARARNIKNRPISHGNQLQFKKIEDDVETLFSPEDEDDECYFEEDDEQMLLREAQNLNEPDWLQKYLPILKMKTLQLTNAKVENDRLSKTVAELESRLAESQHETVFVHNNEEEIEQENASSGNYMEFMQVKRTLKEKEMEINRLLTERVDLDAQIQQIHEAYQTRMQETQREFEEKLQEIEKDKFYYRKVNRSLKEKLQSFIALQEKQNEQLKRVHDLQKENEELKQLLLK